MQEGTETPLKETAKVLLVFSDSLSGPDFLGFGDGIAYGASKLHVSIEQCHLLNFNSLLILNTLLTAANHGYFTKGSR